MRFSSKAREAIHGEKTHFTNISASNLIRRVQEICPRGCGGNYESFLHCEELNWIIPFANWIRIWPFESRKIPLILKTKTREKEPYELNLHEPMRGGTRWGRPRFTRGTKKDTMFVHIPHGFNPSSNVPSNSSVPSNLEPPNNVISDHFTTSVSQRIHHTEDDSNPHSPNNDVYDWRLEDQIRSQPKRNLKAPGG